MNAPRCTLAAIALLIVLFMGGDNALAAERAESMWLHATELMAAGDDKEAAEELRMLVREHPQSDLSDDALFLAASLLEEKIGRPGLSSSALPHPGRRLP